MNNKDRQVLEILADNPTISLRNIANKLSWLLSSGEPNAVKVSRIIKRLQKNELIDKNNILTELGCTRLDEQQPKPNGLSVAKSKFICSMNEKKFHFGCNAVTYTLGKETKCYSGCRGI